MTVNEFSEKWKDFPEIRDSTYDEQILAILGVDSIEELKEFYKDGCKILDAGCGIGWTAVKYNFNPNTQLFLVDPSDSIEIAREYTKDIKNVKCIKSTIYDLRFSNFFDTIICNGVLHHILDPFLNFNKLCRMLKVGGTIGIYVYKKKPLMREVIDNKIRHSTMKFTAIQMNEFSRQVAKLGKSFSDIKEKILIYDDIPLLGIKSGEYDLQKFIYNYFMKCYYNEKEGDKFSASVNFDWYYPKIAFSYELVDIEKWFKLSNVDIISVKQPRGYENSGYFVSGKKVK